MKISGTDETMIGVTSFKARCLAIIDDVAKGRTNRVLLMKRNRPVAAIVPIMDENVDLWGSLRGTVKVSPGVDLAEPTGEVWDADR